MKQYQSFIFDSYAFDPEAGEIKLHYSLDDEIHFTETLSLPTPYAPRPTPSFDATLLSLHLIAGISYYKTCCPKNIEIRSGSLTKEQADFWNTVYTKGLGEFFFRNQIDFHGLIGFPKVDLSSEASAKEEVRIPNPDDPTPYALRPTPKLLLPIGGGKDSIVTAELLKNDGFDVTLLRIGRHPLIEEAARVAGLPLLCVERRLAPELFDLNEQGALNGHVPITAYLSMLSVLIAELSGFDAVVMSNERSANEGNVEYLGEMINHQWSKSLEFEQLLRTYLKDIDSPVEYFSLLRPLSELAITKIFATLPQYFAVVASCNRNWKILSSLKAQSSKLEAGRWCGHCPKCAFAFTILTAFLPGEKLIGIFGENLFERALLLTTFRQLLGLEGFKPFECVGTPEETTAAFLLAHERGDLDETKAMQLFLKEVLPKLKNPKNLIEAALKPSPDHCIPPVFSGITQTCPLRDAPPCHAEERRAKRGASRSTTGGAPQDDTFARS